MAKILLVDFDGVIHSYKSGWKGEDQIPDPPVEGAIPWLLEVIESNEFEVNIYSSRSRVQSGIDAMCDAIQRWIVESGLRTEAAAKIIVSDVLKFPAQKPAAFLLIDDRCMRFEGVWPTVKMMKNYRTWQGR